METVQVFGQTLILHEALPSGNRRFVGHPDASLRFWAFYDLRGDINGLQDFPTTTWQIGIFIGATSKATGFGMTIAEAELDMKARLIQAKTERETLLAAIESKPFPEIERRSQWERLLNP